MERSASLATLLSRLSVTKEHMTITNYALVKIAGEKTPSGKGSQHRAITNHAIKRNAEGAIRLLYTHLNEYLKSLLTEMYGSRPLEVANKAQGSLKFHEIIKLGSYDAISAYIVEHVFRTLESEKNTRLLLKKLLANTGVQVPTPTLEEAMMYLDMRHLIVHNASVIDDNFARTYQEMNGDSPFFKRGAKLPISVGLAKKAIAAIKNLCKCIDGELVERGYIEVMEKEKSVAAQPVIAVET